jgi:hypothetical protein
MKDYINIGDLVSVNFNNVCYTLCNTAVVLSIPVATGDKCQLDGLEFLKTLDDKSIHGVLFDPPYSVEQCLRRYTPKHNGTAGRAEYWARCKDEIKRIVMPGGLVMSFCWDSTGVGKGRNFEIIEIMLLCHGACHNDTIITIERAL